MYTNNYLNSYHILLQYNCFKHIVRIYTIYIIHAAE